MNDHDLLVRIDERTLSIQEKLDNVCGLVDTQGGRIDSHDISIDALQTRGRENRTWLTSMTAGLVAVVGTTLFFFLRHLGFSD